MAHDLNIFVEKTKILASKVNENFENLQANITEVGNLVNDELGLKIDKVKEDLLVDINAVKEEKANKDLSNVESDVVSNFVNYSFPKWEARISRIANTEYQAETAGFVYIATNESDGKKYSNWGFSISADGSAWQEFPVKTIRPDTGRDNRTAFFPIPKGYHYKAPDRSFSAYYFIPCVGG
jgi:hypothetical protein